VALTNRLKLAMLVLPLMLSSVSWGQNALIVHDGTAGTEADVLANLTAKLVAAAFTVTPNVGVPGGSLATYQQVWDIRFNNTTPLTAGDITAYVTYMNGGGRLFVMGENLANFLTRDNSIVTLIQSAGGGTIVLASPANSVTVKPPFTGPNAITNPFTFLSAGGTGSAGPYGAIATDAANLNSGIVYGPTSLANAPTGSLIIVFDVNFMLTGADANSQNLLRNLIAYLVAPTPVGPFAPPAAATPTLSTWAFLVFAAGLMYVAFIRLRRNQQAGF
jgi:hypothetical protein